MGCGSSCEHDGSTVYMSEGQPAATKGDGGEEMVEPDVESMEVGDLVGVQYFVGQRIAGYSSGGYAPKILDIQRLEAMEVIIEKGAGHCSPVTSLAVMASQTAVVTCAHDGQAIIWTQRKDTENAIYVFKLLSCGGAIPLNHVGGSRDGTCVVASAGDSLMAESVDDDTQHSPQPYVVYVWRINALNDGIPREYAKHLQEVIVIDYCDNSSRVATGSRDGLVHIWQPVSCITEHILSLHTSPITSLSFSEPERCLLATADANKLSVWDTTTGVSTFTLSASVLDFPTIRAVEFITPYHVLVLGSSSSTAYAISAMTGEIVSEATINGAGLCVSKALNHSVLVSTNAKAVSQLRFDNLCKF